MVVTQYAANRVLSLANVYAVDGESSGVAFDDADRLYVAGKFEASARRALTSLAHSVGIFHGAYEVAAGIVPDLDPFKAA